MYNVSVAYHPLHAGVYHIISTLIIISNHMEAWLVAQ